MADFNKMKRIKTCRRANDDKKWCASCIAHGKAARCERRKEAISKPSPLIVVCFFFSVYDCVCKLIIYIIFASQTCTLCIDIIADWQTKKNRRHGL